MHASCYILAVFGMCLILLDQYLPVPKTFIYLLQKFVNLLQNSDVSGFFIRFRSGSQTQGFMDFFGKLLKVRYFQKKTRQIKGQIIFLPF